MEAKTKKRKKASGKPAVQKSRHRDEWFPAVRHKNGLTRLGESSYTSQRQAKRAAVEIMKKQAEDAELI